MESTFKMFYQLKSTGLFLTFICFLFISISLFSQENQIDIKRFSINPKLGVYMGGNETSGFSMGLETNITIDKTIYSMEYYRAEEFVIFGSSPAEVFNNFGIMIGKYKGERLFRFEYQAGLGLIWGTNRTEKIVDESDYFSILYETESFATPSIMTKLGFKFIPLKCLGIGLDLEGNINLEKSIFIPMLSIECGNLRSKLK